MGYHLLNDVDMLTGKKYEDLTNDEFIDCFGSVKCSMCAKHQKCGRLSKVELARPWFASCSDGKICADFEPPEYYILLKKYWRGCDIYYKAERQDLMIPVCLNHDQSIRYFIKYSDFYFDTMFDEYGNLKWILKQYYKRTKDSPTGYRLVTERRESDDFSLIRDMKIDKVDGVSVINFETGEHAIYMPLNDESEQQGESGSCD